MPQAITVAIPKETSFALKKGVAHLNWVYYTESMPDQPAADKDTITIRVSRALKKRLQKLAERRNESLTDVVLGFIEKAVRGVELTAQDYKQIAADVAEAEKRIEAKKSKKKNQ